MRLPTHAQHQCLFTRDISKPRFFVGEKKSLCFGNFWFKTVIFRLQRQKDRISDMAQTGESTSNEESQQDAPQVNMAGILQGLQASLAQLAKSSELQTETLQSLKEDFLLRSDDEENDVTSVENGCSGGNTIDVESTMNQVLDTSNNNNNKQMSSAKSPDPGPQNALIDSLTQAFTPNKAKSPAIEGKLAELVDNMLIGGLSTETVKERAEKHSPPENCKYLSVTTVNEEIWDLLPRKTRAVDLAFQRIQEPLLQGLSALTNLAGKLVKDLNDGKTPDTRHVLDHVMDGVALLGNANWKLNMKRRELIKPDLNPPYTRLCKEDIKPSAKLFGEDLPKHLKDMSEAKKAGQQMQKASSSHNLNRGSGQFHRRRFARFKPYDRERSSSSKLAHRQPFLGHGRSATNTPFRRKNPAPATNSKPQ